MLLFMFDCLDNYLRTPLKIEEGISGIGGFGPGLTGWSKGHGSPSGMHR